MLIRTVHYTEVLLIMENIPAKMFRVTVAFSAFLQALYISNSS